MSFSTSKLSRSTLLLAALICMTLCVAHFNIFPIGGVQGTSINIWKHRYPFYGNYGGYYPFWGGGYGGGYGGIGIGLGGYGGGYGYGRR